MATLTKRHDHGVARGRGLLRVRTPRPRAGGLGALAVFVALAYALTWVWMTPFVLVGDVIEKGSGWPTHVIALFGPMAAAVVVTAWVSGRGGLADLVKRMSDGACRFAGG